MCIPQLRGVHCQITTQLLCVDSRLLIVSILVLYHPSDELLQADRMHFAYTCDRDFCLRSRCTLTGMADRGCMHRMKDAVGTLYLVTIIGDAFILADLRDLFIIKEKK
jgi:hypothetical protein